MFSNHNEEHQKIYILENKIWKEEIIKYIRNENYNLRLQIECLDDEDRTMVLDAF